MVVCELLNKAKPNIKQGLCNIIPVISRGNPLLSLLDIKLQIKASVVPYSDPSACTFLQAYL